MKLAEGKFELWKKSNVDCTVCTETLVLLTEWIRLVHCWIISRKCFRLIVWYESMYRCSFACLFGSNFEENADKNNNAVYSKNKNPLVRPYNTML